MIYRKDRKVLKRVDFGAAKNSLMGVLAALVVYALVIAWGRVYEAFQLEALIAGGAVVVVTAFRLWLVARFEGWFAASTHQISAKFFDQEDNPSGGHFLLPQTFAPLLRHVDAATRHTR